MTGIRRAGLELKTSPPAVDCSSLDPQLARRALAIHGGRPARSTPPPAWPVFEADEVAAVVDTLRSGKVNYWTGKQIRSFEDTFSNIHDMPFAVAVANGTVALEAVLRGHGIGPGDEVIVTARSFIASASCVNIVGATPVFADIDLDSEAITPATVRPLIGDKTKAIIVVHLNGWPADMPGFMELAERHDLFVFEDCAQAQGARVNGKLVGSFGHASAFSFCQDKIMTTGGEGGMALFKNEDCGRKAWSYRDNGKDYIRASNRQRPSGFRWLCTNFGSNWRMTEMQAAIGVAQLSKVNGWLGARNANAQRLAACLAAYPSIHVPNVPAGYFHSFYRLSFRVDESQLKSGWDRDQIMTALIAEGIPCMSGACPEIYLEDIYAKSMTNFQRLPNAAYLGKASLALLVHPTIDEQFLQDCQIAIEKVIGAATN